MKTIEEKEDCFILDFDPFDSFDIEKLSLSGDLEGDKDLAIIHETGQVACRDYQHPRHLCLKFPFGSTPNATHCHLCYCCVCDKPAPCAQWMSSHCNASADSMEAKLPITLEESTEIATGDFVAMRRYPLRNSSGFQITWDELLSLCNASVDSSPICGELGTD